MTETRAIAQLPQLEIEIRHKELEAENAEFIAITLKATPNLQAVANWLTPFSAIMAVQPWNPWMVWHKAAISMWQPWLQQMSAYSADRTSKLEDARRTG